MPSMPSRRSKSAGPDTCSAMSTPNVGVSVRVRTPEARARHSVLPCCKTEVGWEMGEIYGKICGRWRRAEQIQMRLRMRRAFCAQCCVVGVIVKAVVLFAGFGVRLS